MLTSQHVLMPAAAEGQPLVVPWESGQRKTIRITIKPPEMPRAERLLVSLFFSARQCVKHGAGICWMSSSSVSALSESEWVSKRRRHSGPIDNVVRDVIPAFGPGRPSPSHLHTKAHTAWVNKLQKWEIPIEIRVCLPCTCQPSLLFVRRCSIC